MRNSLTKVLCFCGILSLIHVAYSAAKHRSYLRLTEQEFTMLPVDIIIQGLLSLYGTMYAVLLLTGEFKEIRANEGMENKSWETLKNRPSFYIFSHRSFSSQKKIED